MKTYNFEQAMEAVAHGITVVRATQARPMFPEGDPMYSNPRPNCTENKLFTFTLNDFYANDWVEYKGAN